MNNTAQYLQALTLVVHKREREAPSPKITMPPAPQHRKNHTDKESWSKASYPSVHDQSQYL